MKYALKRQREMLAAEKLARVRREIDAMKAIEKTADELRLKGKIEEKVTK